MMPEKIFNRFLLIQILPIIILQILVFQFFVKDSWQDGVRYGAIMSDIAKILRYSNENASNNNWLDHSDDSIDLHPINTDLEFWLSNYPNDYKNAIAAGNGAKYAQHDTALLQELLPDISSEFSYKMFYWESSLFLEATLNSPGNANASIHQNFESGVVYLPAETKIVFKFPKIYYKPNDTNAIFWIFLATIAVVMVSLLFLKNQVRSIAKLAKAAEKLGKGQDIAGFAPTGAAEVKTAGKAILKLQERTHRQVRYRSEMLAHISHDLRTPLTRMRLLISFLDAKLEPVPDLESEINEMEKMIQSYINFAKEDGNENVENLDIVMLMKSILGKFHNNKIEIEYKIHNLSILVKPISLKRAIVNAINNALQYSSERILITVERSYEYLYIIIEDDGPGIPEEKRYLAFLPFQKLTSKDSGHGLGLAIIKSIMHLHGGDATIDNSKQLGGTMLSMKIPI